MMHVHVHTDVPRNFLPFLFVVCVRVCDILFAQRQAHEDGLLSESQSGGCGHVRAFNVSARARECMN